jgi:hypothetical protein
MVLEGTRIVVFAGDFYHMYHCSKKRDIDSAREGNEKKKNNEQIAS